MYSSIVSLFSLWSINANPESEKVFSILSLSISVKSYIINPESSSSFSSTASFLFNIFISYFLCLSFQSLYSLNTGSNDFIMPLIFNISITIAEYCSSSHFPFLRKLSILLNTAVNLFSALLIATLIFSPPKYTSDSRTSIAEWILDFSSSIIAFDSFLSLAKLLDDIYIVSIASFFSLSPGLYPWVSEEFNQILFTLFTQPSSFAHSP